MSGHVAVDRLAERVKLLGTGSNGKRCDYPPWPPRPIPWGFSWAYAETQLEEDLRQVRAELRKRKREHSEVFRLKLGKMFKVDAWDRLRAAYTRLRGVRAELAWCRRALSCVAEDIDHVEC